MRERFQPVWSEIKKPSTLGLIALVFGGYLYILVDRMGTGSPWALLAELFWLVTLAVMIPTGIVGVMLYKWESGPRYGLKTLFWVLILLPCLLVIRSLDGWSERIVDLISYTAIGGIAMEGVLGLAALSDRLEQRKLEKRKSANTAAEPPPTP